MSIWILCGLPHCGKTTQGKKLAASLEWKFIDTDEEAENLYEKKFGVKRSCREISKIEGTHAFRELEKEALLELKLTEPTFLALGGGTLLDPLNREYVRKLGTVVYLQASPHEILPRILHRGIPTYLDPADPEASFLRLVQERESLYTSVANQFLDTTGKDEQQVFNVLYKMVVNHGK